MYSFSDLCSTPPPILWKHCIACAASNVHLSGVPASVKYKTADEQEKAPAIQPTQYKRKCINTKVKSVGIGRFDARTNVGVAYLLVGEVVGVSVNSVKYNQPIYANYNHNNLLFKESHVFH